MNVSGDDTDKFERKEITKERTFAKNICYDWYDWLINYIIEPTKTVRDAKQKIMKLLKLNTTNDYSKPSVKNVHDGGKRRRKQ